MNIFPTNVQETKRLFKAGKLPKRVIPKRIIQKEEEVTPTTQLSWFIDSINGDDKNSGLTESSAIKTNAEIVRRWGTTNPNLTSITGWIIVTYLNSTPASDPWIATPIYGEDYAIEFVGQPTPIGVPSIITAYTPPNYGTAGAGNGTRANISVRGVTSWVVGTLVRSSTYTLIVTKDLGGGVAEISTPMAWPITGPLATPAINDVVQLLTRPSVYRPRIDFSTSLAVENMTAINFQGLCEIYQPVKFYECYFWVTFTAIPYLTPVFNSCYIEYACSGCQGHIASVIDNTGSQPTSGSYFDGDTYINGTTHSVGPVGFAQVSWGPGAHNNPDTGSVYIGIGELFYGAGRVWGPGTLYSGNGSAIITGSAVASLLCVIAWGNAAQGYSFTGGTYTAQALTPANIDEYGGLQDPASGSTFQNSAS